MTNIDDIAGIVKSVRDALPAEALKAATSTAEESFTAIAEATDGTSNPSPPAALTAIRSGIDQLDHALGALTQVDEKLAAYLLVLAPGDGSSPSTTGTDTRSAERPNPSTTAPSTTRPLVVDEAKFSYLFGKVASNEHNQARSAQMRQQFQRIGVHDTPAGRGLLAEHFAKVVDDDSNVMDTFTNQYGTFQVRDSLFAGPGGFLHFETTWHVSDDGHRLTTVIPRGAKR